MELNQQAISYSDGETEKTKSEKQKPRIPLQSHTHSESKKSQPSKSESKRWLANDIYLGVVSYSKCSIFVGVIK